MRNIKIVIIISVFIITTLVLGMAKAADASNTEPLQAGTSQAEPAEPQENLYCPDPKSLQKDKGWWKVDNIWKSDSQSSGKKIKEFIGAQWVGVKIGKIICLYNEEERYAFPVALVTVQSVLIFDPTATSWIATKAGYKTCVSHDVLDCPFLQQRIKEKADLYEQIKYKNQPVNNSQ